MPTKIVNTTGQYGDATDFSSVTVVIPVDVFGNYSNPAGTPSYNQIDCGTTITVPTNQNLLVAQTIFICGHLILDGRMISVV